MGPPCRGLRLDRRSNGARRFCPPHPHPTPIPTPPPPRDSGMSCSRAPCSAGHRQKLEDQTKAFPDRFGELERLRMRVTPSTPSPRSSLSTTSHFGSQAQTPIQGMSPSGDGGWGGQGPGALGAWAWSLCPRTEARRKVLDCTALVLTTGVRVPTCSDTHPALRACSARSWAQPFLPSLSK